LQERFSRRVAYFKLIIDGDVFAAIPKADCRLYGAPINEAGYKEYAPSDNIIEFGKFVF